jgi:hypothetical protein
MRVIVPVAAADLARSATVAQHQYDRHAGDRPRALAIWGTPRIRWHANPPLDFLLADSRQKSVALAGHYTLSLPGPQSQPSAHLDSRESLAHRTELC